MRKTRAPTQSQRAIGHIAALQSIATMFDMHAMVGRSPLQFKMPRLDAYRSLCKMAAGVALAYNDKQGATLVVAIFQFVVVALGALGL